ncbi:hypothetical protein NDU88_003668 [Pleurodeles waltl]|uniref:Uncharacterized protein n=1 Tax=Pleurodeles waltl TaxID=8319 RepID=A0AAV7NLA3_PLEWA|nr:hypothetical protein NDU88_003668 [Pleurodeles waltl]
MTGLHAERGLRPSSTGPVGAVSGWFAVGLGINELLVIEVESEQRHRDTGTISALLGLVSCVYLAYSDYDCGPYLDKMHTHAS